VRTDAGATRTVSPVLLAYDYPLWGLMLSMAWFFLWVILIFLLVRVVADIFRSHELSGVAKALWLVFVLFVPWIGAFAYLLTRGANLDRDLFEARAANERAAEGYLRLRG